MIAAGLLRHRVTLQRKVATSQNPQTGAPVYEWLDIATVWAEVAPLSAREFVASQAMPSQVTTRMTIRYRDDVDSQCRAIHRGKVFDIHGVLPDVVSGIEYLTLPCSQGANDG